MARIDSVVLDVYDEFEGRRAVTLRLAPDDPLMPALLARWQQQSDADLLQVMAHPPADVSISF